MCGRLVLTSNYKEKIKAIFDGVDADEWFPPRYNITPGQKVPVARQSLPKILQWTLWGFNPSTAESGAKRSLLINARAETADRLPTFRTAFKQNRCIIFADGFYEWKRTANKHPRPYFFHLNDHGFFALAGLFLPDASGRDGGCVVLTTEANSLMHPIHSRMPVLFTPQTASTWLEPETSLDTLRTILQPYPSNEMSSHPVSDRVNRASSDGPDLIDPVNIIEQTEFF